MKEEWRRIPNFSNYEVSSEGRLKTFNWKGSGLERIIKPSKTKDGYLKTMLKADSGKYHSWVVHKWVAMAFIGDRPDKFEINHLNGIKDDNSVSNLEYCSKKDNMLHAYKVCNKPRMKGEINGMAKLSNKDVAEIREYVSNCTKRYYGRKALAEKYGVSECTIKEIVSRRKNKFSDV